jgi:hypothetical protein
VWSLIGYVLGSSAFGSDIWGYVVILWPLAYLDHHVLAREL